MATSSDVLDEAAASTSDPMAARSMVRHLCEQSPAIADRLVEDPPLAHRVLTVAAAGPGLARTLLRDPGSVEVLSRPDRRQACDPATADDLVAWKRREVVRIAAADLLGETGFEATVAAISAAAADVLEASLRLAGTSGVAVIGMGKLGGAELNYASDVDVVLVTADGGDDALRATRQALAIAARCWVIDTALRPEGRDGPLLRTVDGFRAHWGRWADPWERQALLKARPVAGDPAIGAAFAEAAAEHLWTGPFGADDIRSVRRLKGRTEALVRTGGGADRDIKRAPGGIRDVEFAAQLLQLVHGAHDPSLRVRGTLPALVALTAGGYVDGDDATWLSSAYRFLRRVEHALQLRVDHPVHAVPRSAADRQHLAALLGFRARPRIDAVAEFDRELAACRATVRAVHERIYFRPLLEAFEGVESPLGPEAAATRLAAFGFTDADRTRQAVIELTRGLTRSSRLMQQMLPLLLDWLSTSPDPDAGLLGLRELATGQTRATALATAFRDSPRTAHRLCTVVGTSRKLAGLLARNPDLIARLGDDDDRPLHDRDDLVALAQDAVRLRHSVDERRRALHRLTDREGLRVAVRDLLGLTDTAGVGRGLAALAEAAVSVAVDQVAPGASIGVVALGRFGGSELSYASDLDLVFVHGGGPADQAEAERAVHDIVRFLQGETPATLVYDVDLDLRPEGRNGPVVRSLEAYRTYFGRWAATWERQAMVRARPLPAGDAALATRLVEDLSPLVWGAVTDEDRRAIRTMKARIEAERIPASEDPQFHLKLGPGALSDVEFCTQLLQLEHGVRSPNTTSAIESLEAIGVLGPEDAAMLLEAYHFCEQARNRWFLVKGKAADSLPQGEDLGRLARSLGTDATTLRDDYRRVTRRSRRVVERRFYGRG